MSATTWATIKPDYMNTVATMQPTRVCAVCSKAEFERADSYYSQDVFWLCPDCLDKLRLVITKEVNP